MSVRRRRRLCNPDEGTGAAPGRSRDADLRPQPRLGRERTGDRLTPVPLVRASADHVAGNGGRVLAYDSGASAVRNHPTAQAPAAPAGAWGTSARGRAAAGHPTGGPVVRRGEPRGAGSRSRGSEPGAETETACASSWKAERGRPRHGRGKDVAVPGARSDTCTPPRSHRDVDRPARGRRGPRGCGRTAGEWSSDVVAVRAVTGVRAADGQDVRRTGVRAHTDGHPA